MNQKQEKACCKPIINFNNDIIMKINNLFKSEEFLSEVAQMKVYGGAAEKSTKQTEESNASEDLKQNFTWANCTRICLPSGYYSRFC